MRQLFYLAGLSGSGKSSALRLLYERLTGTVVEDGDVDVELYYRGRKLALFSRGDWLPRVQDRLYELLKSDCRIIVCVSRDRGQVNNFLRWEPPKFGMAVEAIPKLKAASRVRIKAENELCVNLLYAKLNAWLEAHPD